MTKKKQKISDSKWGSVFKKFWWLVMVVIVGIGWLLYVAASSYMLQQRFASTYEQLDSVYKSLQESTQVASNSQGSITKTCRTNYYGFNSEIECGVYAIFSTPLVSVEDFGSKLKLRLNENGFTDMNIDYGTDAVDGASEFKSGQGMPCRVYWSVDSSNSLRVNLYCRETVPDFLSGYERQ